MKSDATRRALPESGIYVRAIDQDGKWGSVDIVHLDRESLIEWLGKEPMLARNVVLTMLCHNQGDHE